MKKTTAVSKEILVDKSLPYVSTKHGTLMLSNVLRSKKAISASILIGETFIKMRELLSSDLKLKVEIENINKKLGNHDKNIELVFNYLEELNSKKENPRKQIGYTS